MSQPQRPCQSVIDRVPRTILGDLSVGSSVLERAPPFHAVDAAVALAALWLLLTAARVARRRPKTTQLSGPPSPSVVFGFAKDLLESPDAGAMYEAWGDEYGIVYQVPTVLGQSRIILADPRAIAHFYARETWTYALTPLDKVLLDRLFGVGRGILRSEGEKHRRQRKSLTPAFSNNALRRLTSVFYDSAYKVKGAWEALIETGGNDSAVIEVQSCLASHFLSHLIPAGRLDTIGIAGFSHDFGSLDGKPASVTEMFDAFGSSSNAGLNFMFLLAQAFPSIIRLPTPRSKLIDRLSDSMGEISTVLLNRTRKEKELGIEDDKGEKSVIGLLIKAERENAELYLSDEEVVAQMGVLLVAGYETTSIALTWALIELARNQTVQTRLREELLAFGGDPTYDQLSNNLLYLDAVVHETLRMYPPVREFTRVAAEDDVIPVSQPIRTKSGEEVNNISIAKGTVITVNISYINRSSAIWGLDAKTWRPERWLEEDGIPKKAQEVQGHRHLLTFVDGPRTCLGKGFAVAEFKIVLSVLVKNFAFELRDGPETKMELGRGVLPRPKVVGEDGTNMPLRVRRVEAGAGSSKCV
ncbi:cytochrome P450 [Melanogaster broomeanus]|nr:cytochrome P450 [Melanogaster broomeanus]